MAAQRIYASPRTPDVAEQKLKHGSRANGLRPKGVLCPAYRVDDGGDLLHVAVLSHGGEQVRNLQELIRGHARNSRDGFWRVARVLLAQQLKNAARMLQGKIVCNIFGKMRRSRFAVDSGFRCFRGSRLARSSLAREVAALLVIPGTFLVGKCGRVKARKQSVLGKLETLLDHVSGIRVVEKVVFSDAIVFDGVMNEPAQKSNVGPRPDLAEQVSNRSSAGEPRIDNNQLGVSGALGFNNPFETAGMVFCRVTAHDEHHVAILYIDPAVGHRPASECWSQT